ncbi:ABC transporter ATP-binding protein/permease [Acidaminococcus sp. NSJ-142]|jgi:ATP-binding cassette subfamily B protein|uniref:ABC transporter ATP-binding protein n=1 Tax=Acidaminococcus TaxID=904 RepID=UPI000CFA2A9A|nr:MULTISPECIES: ABC transporter ATP-binding protein [Acidaminococcus]MCD2435868.1 ABC transporter ATP-binding protein/permease [Acidaminococcus hominis]MCH4095608.1 ABC transporter ATP-binding protein/permease [Acidaminococcus provencensis]RHJ97909.1 ABC transporter ATP-binding protein [Acidaminococcus sp. AM05-11]
MTDKKNLNQEDEKLLEELPQDENVTSLTTLKKVLNVIDAYRILLVLSIVLAGVSVVLQLYVPVLFGRAIDGIVGAGRVDFALVGRYLTRIIALVALSSLATLIMNLINNRLTYRTVRDIRAKAIRQIQVLPLSYLDGQSIGDLVQRVIADVDQVSDGLLLGFTQLFTGIITILVTLYIMFTKNVEISLMIVVLTPVSFFAAKFIATHSYHMFRQQTAVRGRQTALINEMVGSEKVVKAFRHEAKASEQFDVLNKDLQHYTQHALFYSSLTNPSTRAVNNVIYALVALLGAFRILSGTITVGDLTVLLYYANQYMKPFTDISSVVTELQNAMACAARVFTLIDAQPQSPDPQAQLAFKDGKMDIQHVYFSYVKDKKLIEDFNFHVEPGQTTAIVGPTGCGKSTFINLLMRFYDVDQGTISIDGQDTQTVDRHSLRKTYGMVLQETWLKQGTIRENIAFGKPGATEEEIIHAAKEAHSWEFIRRLPQGLDTVVDDDSLSQGQKQLLCITRVMLALPPMLILDEATSSIDTRTELRIQAAFAKLMKGRTSFIVAHRLSTIRSADQILVMRDGKIIEQGTHDTLMAQNGFYTQLYNSQFAQ